MSPAPPRHRRAGTQAPRRSLGLALALSLGLLALRLDLARTLGFGDAEALYVAYSLHPQPAYLDHPGLVGWIAGLWGGAGPPSPRRVHVLTAVLATLFPWLGVLTARILGVPWSASLRVYFALALAPQLAIGLFALTPDLPLAYAWLITLSLAGFAFERSEPDLRRLLAYVATGFSAALACLAKASGALLSLGVLIAALGKQQRGRFRTLGPWAALLLFAIVSEPFLRWEVAQGFPLLEHRLSGAAGEVGFSLRNLGRLLGGQLLYVTPPFLIGAFVVARDLFRRERRSALDRLLQASVATSFFPLLLLCWYSAASEPHWLMPAYLGLALHLARVERVGRWLALSACGLGLAVIVAGYVWVRTDAPIRIGDAFGGYEPTLDPSNDLLAWQTGAPLLREAVEDSRRRTGRVPVVVGPHWVVCAQAEVLLGGRVPVGCASPLETDYDRWLPRSSWRSAPTVLFVTDSRFGSELPPALAEREVLDEREAEVRRAGRLVRKISVIELGRSAQARAR